MIRFLKDLFSITLPHRAFAACISFIAGLFQGGGIAPQIAFFGLISIIATYSSQAVFNNIRDIEGDKINASDRPLARGAISVRSAWILMGILAAAGFAFSYLAHPLIFYAGILCALLGVAYSRFTKSRWYLSYLTLTTTHYIVPFAAGYAIFGRFDLRFISIIAFIAVTEVLALSLKDYKDVKGDRKAGLRTLPISFSLGNAANITFIGLCLPLALVWIPWSVLHLSATFLALYLVAGIIRCGLGLKLLANPGPESAGSILKAFRYVILLQMAGWCIS